MKKLLIGLAVVVVLLIAAGVVISLIPLDSYKGEIQARVKEATGRDLRIDGDISLSLFPPVAVSVEDVGFANAPGATTPEMATIDRLDVALQILPLLGGEVAIDRFILEGPVINLEIDEQGRANWQLQTAEAEAAPAPSAESGEESTGGAAVSDLRLGDVRIVDGTLNFVNRQNGQEIMVSDVNMSLSLPSLAEPFAADGSAVWNGEEIALEIEAASPRALMAGETTEVAMNVESSPVTFTFDGAARNAEALGLQGPLTLDVPSIRELAEWTGNPLELPGEGLGPFNVSGQLEMTGAKVALTEATLKLDEINGEGQFSVDATGAKPMIKAELTVDRLNVNPYLPPEQPAAEAGEAGGTDGGAAGGDAGGEWSDEPIDVSALDALNADLAFNAGGIQYRDVQIGQSRLTVVLQDAKLTADLAEMQLYEGSGKGTVVLDGSQGAPAVSADFDLANFQAGPFLNDLAKFDRLLGTTETQISVRGTGASQRELVSNLNGNGSVMFRDGAIKGVNIAAMIRNISTGALGEGFDEAAQTDFAELSGTFTIDQGIVRNDDLSMVAPLLRMTGAGEIPLPSRTVDYVVRPKLVGSIEGQGGAQDLAGVGVPIKVTGPWHDISWQPDLEGLLKDQVKDPSAVIEQLQEGEGAEGLLEGLVPGGGSGSGEGGDSGDSGSSDPLDLKNRLFGN